MERFLSGISDLSGVRLIGTKDISRRVGVFALDFEGQDNAAVGDRLEREFGILSRCGLTDREYDNLAAEWLLHNLAYDLHFMRGSARHVALDFGHNLRREVDYCTRILEILGLV